MAIDGQDNLYLLWNTGPSIGKIQPDGNMDAYYYFSEEGEDIYAMTVDADGNLYVAHPNKVVKVGVNKEVTQNWLTEVGTVGAMAADRDGYLYLADHTASKVKRVTISNGTTEDFVSRFASRLYFDWVSDCLLVVNGKTIYLHE